MATPPEVTKQLEDLEARRIQFRNTAREKRMSVNDYVGDVREACASAHAAARSGLLDFERSHWLDVAAYALARAEVLSGLEAKEAAGGSDKGREDSGQGVPGRSDSQAPSGH